MGRTFLLHFVQFMYTSFWIGPLWFSALTSYYSFPQLVTIHAYSGTLLFWTPELRTPLHYYRETAVPVAIIYSHTEWPIEATKIAITAPRDIPETNIRYINAYTVTIRSSLSGLERYFNFNTWTHNIHSPYRTRRSPCRLQQKGCVPPLYRSGRGGVSLVL